MNVLQKIFSFYYDGLKNMTWLGKKLWGFVLFKALVLVIFVYLLFPNALKNFTTDEEKAEHVSNNILWIPTEP